ncbi:uncharacterized protein LOC142340354 [Convolutriloba macropyga]|uniref:uncharacterized protein LOC142340354 n=1 Tax=Convolutriloba macropyga TaxID=536237 RepID=UPI003F51FFDA
MTELEPEKIWYLPHHTVQNPNKPGKIRRVANAASKYRGQSLNSNLLTGPDLLNSLLGILLRFRENPVAILADIERSTRLTSDVFHTIMVETESMLNSRPPTHVADVPDNEEPITPNHFLVQRLYNSLPPGDFSSTMPASFKSWKNVQQLMNHV